MKNYLYIFFLCAVGFSQGCIGDDIIFDTVDPVIRITNPIDTIAQDSQYVFEIEYFNNVGKKESVSNAIWSSSHPDIIDISASGVAKGLMPGSATIKVEVSTPEGAKIEDELLIVVGKNTVIVVEFERTGTAKSTSSYVCEGSFVLKEENAQLKLFFAEDYKASSNLPGLYIYLTNNPNTTNGAFEVGKVVVFSGAHEYDIPSSVQLNDYRYVLFYCKPFNVKVGDGEFVN